MEFDEFEFFTGISVLPNTAFDQCRNLSNITLPQGLKSIGNGDWQTCAAFRYCTSLKSILLPDGLERIGASAFFGCTGICHFVLPASINYIDQQVFNRNVDLGTMEYFIINAITPPVLFGSNAFDHTDNCPLYVPDSSVTAYKTAQNWTRLANRIKPLSEFME